MAIVGLVFYDSRYSSDLSSISSVNGNSSDTLSAGQPLRLVFTKVDENFREQLFVLPFEPNYLAEDHDPDAASDAAEQISLAEASIWDFAVSPDRAQIFYSAINPNSTSDLWTTSGADVKAEIAVRCEDASCNAPAISPDGRFLAFTKRGTGTVNTSGGLSPPRLWLMNLESGETAQIFSDNQTLGYSTGWSASSQWINFLSPDSNGISLYNLNTAQKHFFETQAGELGAWHPASEQLLFPMLQQVDSQYLVHLYLADAATGSLTSLSGETAAVEDSSPAWSPDGKWIVFRRRNIGPNYTPGKQIWIMGGDGSNPRPLTDAEGSEHGQPTWSPDGRYLLYHRFPLQGPDIVLSVWITDVETGEHFEIVRPGQRPRWG